VIAARLTFRLSWRLSHALTALLFKPGGGSGPNPPDDDVPTYHYLGF